MLIRHRLPESRPAINPKPYAVFMQSGFAPLTVKWSDPNLGEKKRKAADELNDPNRENNQVSHEQQHGIMSGS